MVVGNKTGDARDELSRQAKPDDKCNHHLNLVDLLKPSEHKSLCSSAGEKETTEYLDLVADNKLEFNRHLLWAAQEYEGQSIYQAPQWADKKLQYIPRCLGCASTVSNLIRLAMKHAKIIDWKDDASHRELFQINIEKLLPIIEAAPYNAKRIADKDATAGDIIVGLGPADSDGHMGIIGNVEGGKRQVYDNKEGVLVKRSLTERFARYPTRIYLRMNFSPAQQVGDMVLS